MPTPYPVLTSLLGEKEVFMSLARWMQMLGTLKIGRFTWTNWCTRLPSEL